MKSTANRTVEYWLDLALKYEKDFRDNKTEKLWFNCLEHARQLSPDNPAVLVELATAYFYGFGVKKDLTHGRRLLRAAAKGGNAKAQCELGRLLYSNGDLFGFRKNANIALKWFRSAAEQGLPEGQHFLGLMYARGDGGLAVDRPMATYWLKKASKHQDFPYPNQYLAQLWGRVE